MSVHKLVTGSQVIEVGWDHPLQTYFGKEYDINAEDPDSQPQVWVGTSPHELYEIENLSDAMKGVKHAPGFIHLISTTLYEDKDLGR